MWDFYGCCVEGRGTSRSGGTLGGPSLVGSIGRRKALGVSVVIPTLNEEQAIRGCLAQFQPDDGVEVLVVDGGSIDGTQESVREHGSARLLVCEEAGRALQMNRGARVASGDILLFLHADTRLPAGGLDLVVNSLGDPEVVGGRFRLGLSEGGWAFQLIAVFSTFRSRFLGITYGDQGIFVRRSAFEMVNGFPPIRVFEDSEFCSAVSALEQFTLLDASVCSSTRRWRRWGILRTVLWMWVLRVLYLCSVPHGLLARLYRDVR